MDVEGEMENLTDPLLTQLSTEAHTQTLKNQTDKCAGADTGRLRHKPHTRPGTSISIDGGLPQQVSLIVPQEREFTKETKTLKQGQGGGQSSGSEKEPANQKPGPPPANNHSVNNIY